MDMIKTTDANIPKPILIYDGDCGFCVYWVKYWQKLTLDQVCYKPYQEVASNYPTIPPEDFKRAIQYVSPDGKIASAAEASFLTLSHAPSKRFWLTLYQKLPGFSFISEKAYALIASHRTFFYYISLLLWGRDYEPPRYDLSAWLFLRALGIVFLIAFFSFGTQALGLIGSHGIAPVSEFLTAVHEQIGAKGYWYIPVIFWLSSSDLTIQVVCGSGILLSFFLIFNILPRISLLFLYFLYLSLIYGGQVFMTFQWDLLLIETGVIAFFLICYQQVGIWLIRWLLFRFIFASGMVKIMSGDSTWLDFTSLFYHFLTQPLPTPLAWYADHLPQSLLKAATIATLFIELVIPFFIFFPRRIRFFAAFAILLLQGSILITGNYNFFNLLAIILCLALFDDAALRMIIPSRFIHFISKHSAQTIPHRITKLFTYAFTILTVFISIVLFQLQFGWKVPSFTLPIVQSMAPLRLVSTYGPFAVMTTKRKEIIIEGSNDSVNWKEYSFKYKPGDIYRRPLWNIPFQPRLDWQMWFAALGTAENNPWFFRFLQRLLENSPDVITLLKNNPFPDSPPYYVRAQLYDYHFTSSKERQETGAWWKRDLIGSYVPDVHLK